MAPALNLPPPDMGGDVNDTAAELRKLRDYVYNLHEHMRYHLGHIDDENIAGGGLGARIARTAQDAADASNLGRQQAVNVRRQVIASKIYKAADETDLAAQMAEDGVTMAVGLFWIDTGNRLIKRCTIVDPLTWETVKADLVQTSSVDVNDYGIAIKTGGLLSLAGGIVDFDTAVFRVVNGELQLLYLDSSGLSVDAGAVSADYFIGNVVNTYNGGTFAGGGAPQTAIDTIPKYLKAVTVLNLSGTINHDLLISGFYGAELRVNFAVNTIINGLVTVINCSFVNFNGDAAGPGKIIAPSTASATVAPLTVRNVGKFTKDNVKCIGKPRTTASDGSDNAFYVEYSRIFLYQCDYQRAKTGINCGYGVSGQVRDCTGGVTGSSDATTIALLSYGILSQQGAHVGTAGTIPTAATANSYASGGTIIAVGTPTATQSPDAGSAPPAAEPVVRSYTPSLTARARMLGTTGYGSFDTTLYPTQGVLDGYRYFGLWMVDASAITNRADATEARLTIKRRATGGSSGAVTLRLMYTKTAWASINGNSYQPYGARSGLFINASLDASLSRGDMYTFNLTGDVFNDIKNGTLKGFGLVDYLTPHGQLYFCPCEMTATLEVTTPT